jgi:hypothetical protein
VGVAAGVVGVAVLVRACFVGAVVSGVLWFDKAGQPIAEEEVFRLKYNLAGDESFGAVSDYARVGLDQVGDAKVSTVWLGLNHEFMPGRPPLIFETMIFGGEYADYCVRYSTEAAAAAGHAAVVAALTAGQTPPDWEDD